MWLAVPNDRRQFLDIDLVNGKVSEVGFNISASDVEEIAMIWRFVGRAARAYCFDTATVERIIGCETKCCKPYRCKNKDKGFHDEKESS